LTFSVSYKRSIAKDLASLPKAEARRVLDKIEQELTTHPDACPASSSKGQFAGLRKLRVGSYRVIFAILDQQVLVLRIGRRRDVYERLGRLE
jgi:mRNA interferase RelE/StbE